MRLKDKLDHLTDQEKNYHIDRRSRDIQDHMAVGKKSQEHARTHYQQVQNNLQQQMTQLRTEYEKIQTQTKHYVQKETEYKEQLTQLQERQKNISHFHCDRIEEPCPYITAINKKGINQLMEQSSSIQKSLAVHQQSLDIHSLEQQQQAIQQQIQTIQDTITQNEKILQNSKD